MSGALMDVEEVGVAMLAAPPAQRQAGALRLALCRCGKREDVHGLCDRPEREAECDAAEVVWVPAGAFGVQHRLAQWTASSPAQRRQRSQLCRQYERPQPEPEVVVKEATAPVDAQVVPAPAAVSNKQKKTQPESRGPRQCSLCLAMQAEKGLSADAFAVDLDMPLDKRRKAQNSKMFFSAEHVALHNTRRSLWVICEGGVFDITSYIKSHPGGPDSLLKNGGTDISKHVVFHSSEMKRLLTNYLQIGVLEGSVADRGGWCTIS